MSPYLQRLLLRLYPLVRRIAPDRHLPWPLFGGRIYLNIRESQMMYQRALAAYEPTKVELIQDLLEPGMSFIDAGANKGYFTLLAATILGGSGHILSVEPEPSNCGWLRRTMRTDFYPNVEVVQLALGSERKRGRLYLGEKSGWHSLVDSGRRTFLQVQVTTLDELVEDSAIDRVDVVKVDVEGSEVDVLKGARRTLAANPELVILMDLHPQLGVEPLEISREAARCELRMFNIDDPTIEILEVPSTPSEVILRR